MGNSYLDHMVFIEGQRAFDDMRDLDNLYRRAREGRQGKEPGVFLNRLRDPEYKVQRGDDDFRIIAEIKKYSPSVGALRPDLSVADLAHEYQEAGATAISVVTNEPFFGGNLESLTMATLGTDLPLLRKDFIMSVRDVYESAVFGADAVLLIARALGSETLEHCIDAAISLGMTPLVEVHGPQELLPDTMYRPETLLGVNQRDLHTFKIDKAIAAAMARRVGSDHENMGRSARLAMSGIDNRLEIERLRNLGFNTFLVGEALLLARDPGQALSDLLVPYA